MRPVVTYQAVITPNDEQPGNYELTVIQSYKAGISGPWGERPLLGRDKAAADAALTDMGMVRMEDWKTQDAYNGEWLVAAVVPADQIPAPEPTSADPNTLPKPGDLVITRFDKDPVIWDGPSDSQFTTLSFGVLSGEKPKRKCDLRDVAPAATPIPAKDDRITVVKANARAHGIWDLNAQAYRAEVPGRRPLWENRKRDVVAAALRALAIDDWHAAHGTV
jgi:hypothetical protein